MGMTPLAVADLALLVHLVRHDVDNKVAQRTVANRLCAYLADSGLAVEAQVGALWVNGEIIHPDTPGATALTDSMLVHDVGRLEFPPNTTAATVLSLADSLGVPPGTYSTFSALLHTLDPVVQQAIRIESSAAGIVVHEPEDKPLLQTPRDVSTADAEMLGGVILPDTNLPEFRKPLEELVERGRLATSTENWDEALTIGLGIVDLLVAAPTQPFRQSCRLALRRLITGPALDAVARATGVGSHRREATTLLRHVGGDATEVLMDLLVQTEGMTERRGYYSALTSMTENAGIIIHHLHHDTWYVVRNAADLCGDMDLVEAIPELARRAHHEDERVRRAIAGALAKLGTSGAMEPIRNILRDASASVRLEALMHLDGRRRGRALAMILAALLEREEHPDVRREMLRALGRIGTTDAVQAILRAAQPEAKLFRGRQRGERLAAIEALTLAGGAAAPALRGLLDDSDSKVRKAVEHALTVVSD